MAWEAFTSVHNALFSQPHKTYNTYCQSLANLRWTRWFQQVSLHCLWKSIYLQLLEHYRGLALHYLGAHKGHNLVSARQGHKSKRHILKTSPFVDKSHFFICWTGFLQNFSNEGQITLSVVAILPCITVRINMDSPIPSALCCCVSHRSGGIRGNGIS